MNLTIIILAAAVIGFIGILGMLALAQQLADKIAACRGTPIKDPGKDLHWTGAVAGGDTLSPRSLGEIRRRIALDSHRARTTAVLKSMRRHARKDQKRGAPR